MVVSKIGGCPGFQVLIYRWTMLNFFRGVLVGSDQNLGWLGCTRDYTTQLYKDI